MEDFKITMQELLPDLQKSKGDGSELFVRGLASTTTVDLHDDRMAETAIAAFKKAIDEGMILKNGKWSYIPLRSGHRSEWDDILGWILKAETDDDHNLWIEAQLDTTNPVAVGLYKKLAEGDKPGKPLQLGLSVGGKIRKASYEWNQSLQKRVRIIEDVVLNEISVVSAPANPPTYLDVLAKSVNWDEILPPNEELLQERTMTIKTDDVTKNDKAPADNTEKQDTPAGTVVEVVRTDVNGNPIPENDTAPEATSDGASADAENAGAESANAENANAEGADADKAAAEPVVENAEEVTKAASAETTDPQATTSVPSMDALVKTFEQLQTLFDDVKKSLPAKEEPKTDAVEAKSSEELLKSLGEDLDTRIANAVAAAFETFRKEQLEPLTEKLTLIKGVIDEMGDQPMDKSSSVLKAKDREAVDPKELINERLQKARQSGKAVNSIREAIKANFGE